MPEEEQFPKLFLGLSTSLHISTYIDTSEPVRTGTTKGHVINTKEEDKSR